MIPVEVTLLSVNEFLKYQDLIPLISDKWWLRTPYSKYGNYVHAIDDTGTINYCTCANVFIGVRPFCVLTPELSDLAFWYKPQIIVGSVLKIGDYSWTVLDCDAENIYVLCNEIITRRRFDTRANVWETSELKQWFDNELKLSFK